MARLNAEIKTFIVQRLAQFDSPTTVSEAVNQEFGVAITRQQVEKYDPGKAAGQQLSKNLQGLFSQCRERYVHATADIAICHKAVRLRRLDRMYSKAEERGNFSLAAALLEQAAKEVGDYYTNLRKIAPTESDGITPLRNMSDQELDQRIDELLHKTGRL